jgi:hypothetical protein
MAAGLLHELHMRTATAGQQCIQCYAWLLLLLL